MHSSHVTGRRSWSIGCLLKRLMTVAVSMSVFGQSGGNPTFNRIVIDGSFAGDVKAIGDVDGVDLRIF